MNFYHTPGNEWYKNRDLEGVIISRLLYPDWANTYVIKRDGIVSREYINIKCAHHLFENSNKFNNIKRDIHGRSLMDGYILLDDYKKFLEPEIMSTNVGDWMGPGGLEEHWLDRYVLKFNDMTPVSFSELILHLVHLVRHPSTPAAAGSTT